MNWNMDWGIAPFRYVYLLAVTLFVGKIATFSFLIAPIVHKILEREQVVKLLKVFFPRYYTVGIGCAVVGLVSAVLFAYNARLDRVYQWTILWAVILVVEVFALKVLVPTIEATREGRDRGDPEATKKWESAHKLSVRLNVLNLLIGLLLVWFYAG